MVLHSVASDRRWPNRHEPVWKAECEPPWSPHSGCRVGFGAFGLAKTRLPPPALTPTSGFDGLGGSNSWLLWCERPRIRPANARLPEVVHGDDFRVNNDHTFWHVDRAPPVQSRGMRKRQQALGIQAWHPPPPSQSTPRYTIFVHSHCILGALATARLVVGLRARSSRVAFAGVSRLFVAQGPKTSPKGCSETPPPPLCSCREIHMPHIHDRPPPGTSTGPGPREQRSHEGTVPQTRPCSDVKGIALGSGPVRYAPPPSHQSHSQRRALHGPPNVRCCPEVSRRCLPRAALC